MRVDGKDSKRYISNDNSGKRSLEKQSVYTLCNLCHTFSAHFTGRAFEAGENF